MLDLRDTGRMSSFFRIVFYLGSALLVFMAIVEVVVGLTGVVAATVPGVFSGIFPR
jgi:hypothetical protein